MIAALSASKSKYKPLVPPGLETSRGNILVSEDDLKSAKA